MLIFPVVFPARLSPQRWARCIAGSIARLGRITERVTMTTPESNSNPNSSNTPSSDSADTSTPAAGIKSRLTDAQKAMLASKSRGGAHVQSVGKSHQPTQASGKKGPVEKKTRW